MLAGEGSAWLQLKLPFDGMLVAILPPGAFFGMAALLALRNRLVSVQPAPAPLPAARTRSRAAMKPPSAGRSSSAWPSQPEPHHRARYATPFELLVAVVLSAQATDKAVNLATRSSLQGANTPQKMLELGESGLEGAHQDDRALQQQGEERDRSCRASSWRSTAARCRASREALESAPRASAARPRTWS